MNQISRTIPIDMLEAHFLRYASQPVFRCRMISANESPGGGNISCCVIQRMDITGKEILPIQRISYPRAELYEDWLTGQECVEFTKRLETGAVEVAKELYINPAYAQNWKIERLLFANPYMEQSGWMVSYPTDKRDSSGNSTQLLVRGLPYYPDIYHALSDWSGLGIQQWHSNDLRNALTFLLPEDRAFFAHGQLGSDQSLHLAIQGTLVSHQEFTVQGAAWANGKIFQIYEATTSANFRIEIPSNTDRLELFLLDETGQVYDEHKEQAGIHHLRPFLQQTETTLHEKLKKALSDGEGVSVEFKSFVNPDEKLTQNGKKTKLAEVLRTVASFSNTQGGEIYIGVDDDCQIVGIEQELHKQMKEPISIELKDRYLGSLRAAIKDNITGEVKIELKEISTSQGGVVLITVYKSASGTSSVSTEGTLLVRRGSSNVRVAPEDWQRRQTGPIIGTGL